MKKGILLHFVFLLLAICTTNRIAAQTNVQDSSSQLMVISGDAGAYSPIFDMDNRFGTSFGLGLSVNFKTRSQWLLGVEYSFVFGSVVKEDTILDELRGTNGYIIADNGIPADVALLNRGHMILLNMGRLFPIIGPNPNSGLLFKLGMGYYQHKIRVETPRDFVPQLSGDNLKYYDRLTGGFTLNSYLGYLHVSNNKRLNFKVGLDFSLAFTKSLRSYDIPSRGPITGNRVDGLIGLRIGWMVPVFERTPKTGYRP